MRLREQKLARKQGINSNLAETTSLYGAYEQDEPVSQTNHINKQSSHASAQQVRQAYY